MGAHSLTRVVFRSLVENFHFISCTQKTKFLFAALKTCKVTMYWIFFLSLSRRLDTLDRYKGTLFRIYDVKNYVDIVRLHHLIL